MTNREMRTSTKEIWTSYQSLVGMSVAAAASAAIYMGLHRKELATGAFGVMDVLLCVVAYALSRVLVGTFSRPGQADVVVMIEQERARRRTAILSSLDHHLRQLVVVQRDYQIDQLAPEVMRYLGMSEDQALEWLRGRLRRALRAG